MIQELKARAYDILVQIQALQNELSRVNQEIVKESEKPKEKDKTDE